MFDFRVYIAGLIAAACLAVATWMLSLVRRDVSIVDIAWSLLFLAATLAYIGVTPGSSPRDLVVLALVSIWALRLAIYLMARNWSQPEDRRYQKIRARNQPHFEFKSLYIVFLLQALLAWIVSLPMLAAVNSQTPLGWLDYVGIAVALFGTAYESIADWQLSRFKANSANAGRVMDCGLWRYSRHPNYFGECCVWWGFYLIACAAGGWWSIPGPLLMTVLLLKVSGVALLEKDIGKRRPAYRDYILSTNAFFPGPPRAENEAR